MPYPTRSLIGLDYPFIFPGTKLDPEKLSNLAIQNFSTLTLNQYPGYWYDFVFSVVRQRDQGRRQPHVQGRHVGGTLRHERPDPAQRRLGTGDHQSERLVPLLRYDAHGRLRSGPFERASRALDDYTEFGNKPLTNFIGMGYDFYGQDSWRVTRKLTLELGLRYSLWQQWRDENNAIASFQSAYYDPANAVRSMRRRLVVPGDGDPFNGIVLPGDQPTEEALGQFPQLANLGRSITACHPASPPIPRTACSRGSDWPTP